MISAIIIENEAHSAESLKSDLKENCPQVQIMAHSPKVAGGIELIEKIKPQLIFLDIELDDGTGFELLEKLDPEIRKNTQIIFTTSFNEFAIRAFRFSAIDYLLKPVDADELTQAVKKAEERISNRGLDENLVALFENVRNRGKAQKLVLPSGDSILVYKIENIIRCESQRNYTMFYFTNDKPLLVSRTMKEYEDLLSGQGFERVHNSHLINMSYVKKYVKSDGGYIEMSDGTNIPVAQAKKGQIMKILSGG